MLHRHLARTFAVVVASLSLATVSSAQTTLRACSLDDLLDTRTTALGALSDDGQHVVALGKGENGGTKATEMQP